MQSIKYHRTRACARIRFQLHLVHLLQLFTHDWDARTKGIAIGCKRSARNLPEREYTSLVSNPSWDGTKFTGYPPEEYGSPRNATCAFNGDVFRKSSTSSSPQERM